MKVETFTPDDVLRPIGLPKRSALLTMNLNAVAGN
jgi:hypothetical protein